MKISSPKRSVFNQDIRNVVNDSVHCCIKIHGSHRSTVGVVVTSKIPILGPRVQFPDGANVVFLLHLYQFFGTLQ